MARLVYSAIASLDGYVADESGRWDWSMPDAEVHAALNDLTRPAGTHLYGRRMYDVLVAWETIEDDDPEMRDFAELWRAADKIVYSRTLTEPRSARTRIEREFDPEAVRRMKAEAERDLAISRAPGSPRRAVRGRPRPSTTRRARPGRPEPGLYSVRVRAEAAGQVAAARAEVLVDGGLPVPYCAGHRRRRALRASTLPRARGSTAGGRSRPLRQRRRPPAACTTLRPSASG